MSLIFRPMASTGPQRGADRVQWSARYLLRPPARPAKRVQLAQGTPSANQSSRRHASSDATTSKGFAEPGPMKRKASGRYMRRILSTLNPEKLGPEDIIDISGLFAASAAPSRQRGQEIHYARTFQDGTRQSHPFPPATCGFFYFHRSSPRPHVAAGEVRFRVIPPDARSLPSGAIFARGSDLFCLDGLNPWRIPLINVFKKYPGIRQILLKDGSISPAEDIEIENLVVNVPYLQHRRVLESISDQFLLNMGMFEPHLTILHQEYIFAGKIFFLLCRPSAESTRLRKEIGNGKAIVRLELANIEETQLKARNKDAKVVLRVLKIVEPPGSEDSPVNQIYKEGELVQRFDLRSSSIVGPWICRNPHRFISPSSMKVLEQLYLKKE
ncbi:hypothetical protein NMY22_g3264 [Coprinellus aureogranulatus]|nr:hypothetical protein NMY22_g3264 [Coprinellus aureogranulatus]